MRKKKRRRRKRKRRRNAAVGAFTAMRFKPWPHCSLTCHHCLN